MSIRVSTLHFLKDTKNSIIGNSKAKSELLRDGEISKILECLDPLLSSDESSEELLKEIQKEAAYIVSSLATVSNADSEILRTLISEHAHERVFRLIAVYPSESQAQWKTALIKALRAIANTIADVIGPDQWGLNEVYSEPYPELQAAFNTFFELANLDAYLPYLSDSSTQVQIAAAHVVASLTRNYLCRDNIIEWLPSSERPKELKGRRGWESTGSSNLSGTQKNGGWAVRQLISLLRNFDAKAQESALLALASLARDNSALSQLLLGSSKNKEFIVFEDIIVLSRSRNLDVQLAACLCIVRIFRSLPSNQNSSLVLPQCHATIHILNNIIANDERAHSFRAKACYLLRALIVDNKDLCQTAIKFGSLGRLMDILNLITVVSSNSCIDWEEEEPTDTTVLREAVLTGLATLTLFDNISRRQVSGDTTVMSSISSCIKHPRVGVRYAACQCVRVLGRDVSNLRTSLLDSGLSLELMKIIKRRDEDKRVIGAALAGLCNAVTIFSPVRQTLLESGLLNELHDLLTDGSDLIKLNAVWVLKNLLHEATHSEKRLALEKISWENLHDLLHSHDVIISEQILTVMRNITVDEIDTQLLFDHADADSIMDELTAALNSHSEDVIVQGIAVVKNICASLAYRSNIFSNSALLDGIHNCMTHSRTKVRREAVECVKKLAQSMPYRHKELRDVGIPLTLRHISSGLGNGGMLSTSPTSAAHQMGMEEDAYTRSAAKTALHYLESPEDLTM